MPSHEQMVQAVESYVAAFDRGDAAAVRDLFASDASVEDPVGTPPQIGHDAILTFFTSSMQTGAKLTLDGPVRSAGNTAAFAFSVGFAQPGPRVDVIDLFTFDEAGKVTTMKAYFGPANMHGFGSADHA